MRSTRIATVLSRAARAALVVLAFASSHASGAPKVPNPPPKVGLSIEPERLKQPPTAKFSNESDHELAIIYGPEKFSLKPGASKSVPVPKPQMFELRIFETFGKGKLRERFNGQATPNDPKRVIPLTFEKPKILR
jgi:hypothetical protein